MGAGNAERGNCYGRGNMKILDVITSPWAIMPDKYAEIQEIYFTHLRGEKIDIKGIEARIGKPLKNEPKTFDITNGVAILQIEGIIAKRMSMFMDISGGTSIQNMERDFIQAINDPEINAIILNIDSPGGTVDGIQGFASMIYQARGKKQIVAYTDGMMASAAYWIGSSADRVYIAGDTTQVGAIGVVAAHIDKSKAEEKIGIKTTEIVAGKYKRIASQYSPLTEEGRAYLQEQVDYFYSIFVDEIAKNRRVSPEKVAKEMSEGKVFFGKQAIDVGLADGVSTLSALIDQLGPRNSVRTTRAMVEARVGGIGNANSFT